MTPVSRPHRWPLALALAALMPLPLQAAGSASLDNGDEVSELQWQDAQTVRIDMSGQAGYMLLRDGKVYMVNPAADGGMPPVMEVGAMMQDMADAFGDDDAQALSDDGVPRNIESVQNLGKTETVAGIRGHVHEIISTDKNGAPQSTEAVLSSDPLAAEMTDAWFAMVTGLLGPEQMTEFKEALPERRRGLLRVGDSMTVRAIRQDPPPASAFELPAEPVDFGQMMNQIMKKMQEQ